MNPFIDLYSATGVLVDKKPYRLAKVLKLIKRGEAVWVTEGATAQLCRLSDAEIAAECARNYRALQMDKSDLIIHKGEWRVVQPPPGTANPSGWQLQHPRINDRPVLMLLEVSA